MGPKEKERKALHLLMYAIAPSSQARGSSSEDRDGQGGFSGCRVMGGLSQKGCTERSPILRNTSEQQLCGPYSVGIIARVTAASACDHQGPCWVLVQ